MTRRNFSISAGLLLLAGGAIVCFLWCCSGPRREIFTPVGGGFVSAFAFSPDGKTLVVGTVPRRIGNPANPNPHFRGKREIQFYDLQTRQLKLVQLQNFPAVHYILAFCYSPDGTRLAVRSLSRDKVQGRRRALQKVWNLRTGQLVCTMPEAGTRRWLSFSPDGRLLAGSSGRAIALWDTRNGQIVRKLEARKDKTEKYEQTVIWASFTTDGQTIISDGNGVERSALLWSVANGKIIRRIPKTGDSFSSALSPDGRIVAIGEREKIGLWDLKSNRMIHALQSPEYVYQLAFSPDGATLASSNANKTLFSVGIMLGLDPKVKWPVIPENIQIWNLRTGKLQQSISTGSHVDKLKHSPDGKILAHFDAKGELNFWHLS